MSPSKAYQAGGPSATADLKIKWLFTRGHGCTSADGVETLSYVTSDLLLWNALLDLRAGPARFVTADGRKVVVFRPRGKRQRLELLGVILREFLGRTVSYACPQCGSPVRVFVVDDLSC